MSVSAEQVKQAKDAAIALRSQGYFERAAHGDERAASYFARLVAYTANPNGLSSGWGALRKTGGGFNVEGYADGAIVCGSDPHDLNNVLKIVTQVGSDHAGIGDAVQERRESDIWEKPKPLTDEQMSYLLSGGQPAPVPVPQPQPVPVVPDREEALDELTALDAYYKAPDGLQRPNGLSLDGKPDFLGIAAWYLDVYQQARVHGKSRAEARAAYVSDIRHSDEWKQKHPSEQP